MSLNIKDAVYGLGEKLGVDMSNAPASNIADTIDYISNGVGAHTGVIAEAVDKLEVSGGGTPEWLYIVDATPIEEGSPIYKLNKTWAEINQFSESYSAAGTGVGVILLTLNGNNYRYVINYTDYDTHDEVYYVDSGYSYKFTANSENDFPTADTTTVIPENPDD